MLERCATCSLPANACLCALVPCVEAATRLVLVINARERRKTSNTGLLAARCLPNSEVHTVGSIEAPVDFARVAPAGALNLVLFPHADAVVLDEGLASAAAGAAGPARLIVPDGDWGQAARIVKKLARGTAHKFVKLPEGPATEYALRRRSRPTPGGLSTIEAVARAMGLLEGAEAGAALMAIFRTFHARTLAVRGISRDV